MSRRIIEWNVHESSRRLQVGNKDRRGMGGGRSQEIRGRHSTVRCWLGGVGGGEENEKFRVCLMEFVLLYTRVVFVGYFGPWVKKKIQMRLKVFGRFNFISGFTEVDEFW